MRLRPYQEEAKKAILKDFESGRQRTLLSLPTGTGKTIVFSSVLDERLRQGGRGLVIAHRDELLTQAQQKLWDAFGLASALEKGDSTALGATAPVAVASVQSLSRPDRLEKFPADYFTDVVIDEAHHSLSDSYRRVIDHFASAKLLGVTATPDRGDKKNLSEIYENIAYEYSMRQAIADGYLCPIKAKMLPAAVDLNRVTVSCGDYTADSLGEALEPYLDGIATQLMQECGGRKTVVFLPLVRTAKLFCELLNSKGMAACEVDGDSPDRERILADFEAGKYQVLCNSMLLTEGWDCPSVSCVVILRPTKIRSLYCQMVGRGTRICPGKEDLLLLDFLYLTEKHDLCTPASLFGSPEEIKNKMNEALAEGEEIDLAAAERQSEKDACAEREAHLRQELERAFTRRTTTVDPLEFAVSLDDADIALYEPTFNWEFERPTEKQLALLSKCGITGVRTKGLAAKLIDKIIKRREAGLCTPRQMMVLKDHGVSGLNTMSFQEASRRIDTIIAASRAARGGFIT